MIVACNNEITEVHYSGYTIEKIYACDGELVYNAETPPSPTGGCYLTFVALEDGTFSFKKSSANTNTNISYSLDNGSTWTELQSESNTPLVASGNTIMWKGELTPVLIDGIGSFSSSGKFDAECNIMSLLYSDDYSGKTSLNGKDYAFYHLFKGCSGLTNTVYLEMPATTLSNSCYHSMFIGCTSLITTPKLPARTLQMSCYENMFGGCTSLETPPVLGASILANDCYESMFNGCTSLKTAPALPAVTLAAGCYGDMFLNCISLTTAPVLYATTLVEHCYDAMFANCSNLNYIKCLATNAGTGQSGANDHTDWVLGVAANGTFVREAGASWLIGDRSGIPAGWTIVDN